MDEEIGEGRDLDGLQPKPAPAPLALVQGFVNTKNIMHGYDLLEDVGEARAWLVGHGLLDEGVRLTGGRRTTSSSFGRGCGVCSCPTTGGGLKGMPGP